MCPIKVHTRLGPRYDTVMARDGLLPEWFARVHPKLGTPANATAFTGITTGLLALLVDIDILAELVSIGTLARGGRASIHFTHTAL